jgi:hypothetical protein
MQRQFPPQRVTRIMLQQAHWARERSKRSEPLKTLDPLFVTGLVGVEDSPAWLAGEVRQYAELKALMDGSKGTLVARMPLTWAFKAEKPLPAAWRYDGPEGAVPLGNDRYAVDEPSLANGWRIVRTDLYLQAQDVLAPDGQSHLGHYWYRSALEITQSGAGGQLHLMFPGLFNEAWLYVNGALVAHRNYKEPWWRTDYRFTWDVDISRYVRRGSNQIAVRGFNPHHFAGMFRRPFVYRPR